MDSERHADGTVRSDGHEYRPFCLADRPNHVRILDRAAEETEGFGVLTQATVSDSVEALISTLSVPVIVDCGAFAEDEFDGTLVELFDTYERMDADYGLVPDSIGDRTDTDDSVAIATRLWQRGSSRWSFTPVAVAQGETPREYAASYWDCYQMGADRIAVGGLLSTVGDRSGGHATGTDDLFEVLEYIREMNPRIWDETWTFALGCDHPTRRPRLGNLAVQAADSKRWLYQYDDDLPVSREEQLANEVVRTASYRTPTLSETISDGGTPTLVPDGGSTIEVPDEQEETIAQSYVEELESRRPGQEKREELRSDHRHHLVRETTSQYSETDAPDDRFQIEKTAHVPDLYCFTCDEWVGISGVDLRGTPRSRKDAYYLGGPPEEVAEARQHVRDSLADLVQAVSSTVPHIEDAHEALDFIEGEHAKARERVTEATDVE